MWLANALRRFVILYLKFLFILAGVCVLGGYLQAWWRSVHLTPSGAFFLLTFGAATSTAAHFIRKHRRPHVEHQARRGAERTPMLPPSGGAQW
jgi:hypothetical protein